MLKKKGFSSHQAIDIGRKYNNLDNIIILKEKGFEEHFAKKGFNLSQEKINKLVFLKKMV